jgi:hypothetical protein
MGLGLGQDAIAIKLRLASTIHKAVISHEDSNQHKNIKNKTYQKKKKREVDAVKDKNICYTLKSSKTKYTIIMRRLSKTLVIAK